MEAPERQDRVQGGKKRDMSSRGYRSVFDGIFGNKAKPVQAVIEASARRIWIPVDEQPAYLRRAATRKRAEAEALIKRAETLEGRAQQVESGLARRAAATELRRRATALEHESLVLKARLATIIEEHDGLVSQLARVRLQKEAIPAERDRLEAELTSLARQGETPDVLRERYDALQSLAAADRQYEAAAVTLEKELAEKEHERQELESQIGALQSQIDTLWSRSEADTRRGGTDGAPGPSDFERAMEFVPRPQRRS